MDELRELLERFCLHPRRRLIVTVVTLVALLAMGTPLVDDYFAVCAERTRLNEQLAESQQTAATLPTLETAAAKATKERSDWEARTVGEKQAPELRSHLVELARNTGCQVRRINFETVQTRAWLTNDDPLVQNAKADAQRQPTPFSLETRPLSMSVVGTSKAVNDLLQQIEQDQKLIHPKVLEVRPADGGRKTVQLDIELWYFALAAGASA